MNLSRKGFLQGFEEGLDEVPLGAPHVDDDGEATFAHVLTVGRSEVRHHHAETFNTQSKSIRKSAFLYSGPPFQLHARSAGRLPMQVKMHCPKNLSRFTPPTEGILLLLALSK